MTGWPETLAVTRNLANLAPPPLVLKRQDAERRQSRTRPEGPGNSSTKQLSRVYHLCINRYIYATRRRPAGPVEARRSGSVG